MVVRVFHFSSVCHDVLTSPNLDKAGAISEDYEINYFASLFRQVGDVFITQYL